MHKFINLLALPVLLSLAACSQKSEASSETKRDIIPVKTIPLNAERRNGTLSLSGQFTTDDEVMLSFKTGGIINNITVKEGDQVKKGQVLATLDLTEINAQVQQAQLALEKAKRDYDRAFNLYKDSVATLEQVQNAQTALDISKQAYQAARFNLAYSQITAPRNGYVLRKLANVGQMVAPGTPVIQTNGASNGDWKLKVGASDKEWALIKINDRALISNDAPDGKTYEGVVSRKSESIDPYTGTFTIEISIRDKNTGGLAAGMFGKAQLSSSAESGISKTWLVPYDALLDADGSTGYVFVTNDGKTASKVKVEISEVQKDHVLVTGGLENARELIVSGSAYLTDKSSVKIIH